MEGEQLKLMKVIEFPKNKEIEAKLKSDKLDIAISMLEILDEEGVDYNIVIKGKDVAKIFECNNYEKDYLIISNNIEVGKKIKLNKDNCYVYEIEGNEAD